MVRWITGNRVYPARRGSGVARPAQWLGRGEKWYYFSFDGVLLLWNYRPFQGCMPLFLCPDGSDKEEDVTKLPDVRSKRMKRISVGGTDGGDDFPLNPDSKLLVKLPRFLEWLTAKKYADGVKRKPGRFWFESDGVAFTITLFEAAACARVRLRAATIDDAFAAAEKHLSAENPPWEVDEYEQERQSKKSRKK